jgi:ATP-dependent Lon protease
VAEEFEKYAKVKKNVPEDALTSVSETTDPAKLADLVSGHLGSRLRRSRSFWKPWISRSGWRRSMA